MEMMTITADRYDELIHKAVRLEMVIEYLERNTCINESDLRMIIGIDKKGDK